LRARLVQVRALSPAPSKKDPADAGFGRLLVCEEKRLVIACCTCCSTLRLSRVYESNTRANQLNSPIDLTFDLRLRVSMRRSAHYRATRASSFWHDGRRRVAAPLLAVKRPDVSPLMSGAQRAQRALQVLVPTGSTE